jgi:hypothetical protein
LCSSKNPVPLNNTSTTVLPSTHFCLIYLHCFPSARNSFSFASPRKHRLLWHIYVVLELISN